MFLSSTAAILASGFWVILLVACALFILVAIKGRRQVEDLEQIVDTQRAHIQRLIQSGAEDSDIVASDNSEADNQQAVADLQKTISELNNKLAADAAQSAAQIAKNEKQIKKLMLQLNELKQGASHSETVSEAEPVMDSAVDLSDATPSVELEELQAHNLQLTQRLDNSNKKLALSEKAKTDAIALARTLKQENAVLDAQLKALGENTEVGDAETMREIIINFTEESRELLMEIEKLEKENKELNQYQQDTESNVKGTTGAVVGLKRKLAEAEEELRLMQEEYQQLKAGKSATA